MSKLTLHRTGSFTVADKAEDSTQCGFRRGDRLVWFSVYVEGDSLDLDQNGFLIDNNAIQHYFDEKYAQVDVFVSCERIACAAIEDIRELVDHERTGRCHFVSVEIKPGDYAGIKAEQRFLCSLIEGA